MVNLRKIEFCRVIKSLVCWKPRVICFGYLSGDVEFAVKFMQIYWRKEALTRSKILKVFVM